MLAELRSADTLERFARVLGYRPSGLSFILYQMTDADKYRRFSIDKKSGGKREIDAPTEKLKSLQTALAKVLTQCNLEIAKDRPLAPLSHGFEPGRSILTNAWNHKNRRFVLNMDIEDFFPSINFGRVRGFFISNRDFGLSQKAATLIAQIACLGGKLPQGSPCSPIISNLIGHLLDVRLVGLAKRHNCSYSRYADDLTFSTNQKDFPLELAAELPGFTGSWVLSDGLLDTINRAGFRLSHAKTRMQCRPSRQLVTGLVVNEKVNIRAEYYRRARKMCSSLFNHGVYYTAQPEKDTKSVPPTAPEFIDTTARLEGILSHIYHIKHGQAQRSKAVIESKDVQASNKIRYPAHRELYKKFLYFKHFVHLEEPLIICEGKTDNIYIRSALKRLAAAYPMLAELEEGKLKTKIKLLKHSRNEHDILGISGGTGDLANLISRYNAAIYRYKFRPLKFPVIIVVDNDSGSAGKGSVFSQARKFLKETEIDLKTKDSFYYLCHNLYLVKTPEVGLDGGSCIEDLFDPELRKTKLDGKTFNPNEDKDTASSYGKLVFADKVVRANFDKIDFSKFEPLLDRIVAAISHYASSKAATTSAKAA